MGFSYVFMWDKNNRIELRIVSIKEATEMVSPIPSLPCDVISIWAMLYYDHM
jgi:hypothetical protein